ncbi:MAG: GH116 family glycosyl hydrolase [Armatimonadota bacterium]|jgi:uncharacterized protein (DUF608 family)
MARLTQTISHISGIPLGGIGAGSVEIRPDGLFHDWLIFNAGRWSPGSPGPERPPLAPEDLVFLVRTRTGEDSPCVRYLALRAELHELYSFSWLKCVEGIQYEGTFPAARLVYQDEALPVRLSATVFSPFIPGDSEASGTPGFVVEFHIENPAGDEVEVSLLGTLRNPAGAGQAGRRPLNTVETADASAIIRLGAEGLEQNHPTTGSMAFGVNGGEVSFISGSFSIERPGLVYYGGSRYGMKVYSNLFWFRDHGSLPDLSPSSPPSLPEGFDPATLPDPEAHAEFSHLVRHSAFHNQYHTLLHAHPALSRDVGLQREFLADAVRNLQEIQRRGGAWGDAYLCSQHHLPPGASASCAFAVAWHFPNHISPTGERLGHRYEKRFSCSTEVAHHLLERRDDLKRRSLALPGALLESSLPREMAEAALAQLSTLTKCTWWTREGRFGVWEGLGCCGFHTMDISYQGSFPLIALFPDLQKEQMTHGARFQRQDGRIPHMFTPDFSAVDDQFERVDMNPQFVMLVARDYLWTGDRHYLRTLWPAIVRAMESSAALDSDGDGLPDTDTRRNTYDVWDFQGCPSYISSLWLGALAAAERLAREMGEDELAGHYRQTLERGLASFEEKLWNGQYYVLWRDTRTGEADECCMSDQVSAEWFFASCGWDLLLPEDRIRSAMSAILTHNFRPDRGLINASYPPGVPHRMPTSGNLQQEATWTGIEYTVAALLIHLGILEEALDVTRDIHLRYERAGRFWNHVECGDHYYRAMSSWTLLLTASGFFRDASSGEIGFQPRFAERPFRCPFAVAGTAGGYTENAVGAEIELWEGSLEVRRLRLPHLDGISRVELNGSALKFQRTAGGALDLGGGVTLRPGDRLTVSL